MRIGIDIRLIGKKRTGDEAVFFNLVKNLAKIDDRNEYLLFTDILEEATIASIKNDLELEGKKNFKIISLKAKNKFCWNFRILPKRLRAEPVDIYLTQYITPFFIPKKIKIFTIIHDVSFEAFPELIKPSDLFFLRLLIPRSLKRADRIIAVSGFTKDELIRRYGIAPEKIAIIPNAVSDRFVGKTYSSQERQAVRKKYGLPEKFILYLGTLQPRKNLPVLIEAYAKMRKDFPEMRLVLAGGKGHNYDQRIDQSIKEYELEDSVLFTGFIDEEDKAAVMSAADCFCFPSLYEGFGIPILEAFSVGTPCVVSDIPPHREVAGEAAFFFDPKDSDELARRLAHILKDASLQERLRNSGRDQNKSFSWTSSAQKMLQLFEEERIDKYSK